MGICRARRGSFRATQDTFRDPVPLGKTADTRGRGAAQGRSAGSAISRCTVSPLVVWLLFSVAWAEASSGARKCNVLCKRSVPGYLLRLVPRLRRSA
jgi:hypothetical protein